MGLFVFVFALIIGLVGLVTIGYAATITIPPPDQYGSRRTAQQASVRKGARLFGGGLVLLAVIFIALDSYTTVAARGVAVQTSFGRVRGEPLGPGFHDVPPWNNVEEFDASVQTLKFYQAEKDDDGSCMTVRLGNNTPACVDVTLQWNINHKGDVNDLYLRYKTFDNIHDNLVTRQLGSALNEVFGTYDPLSAVGSVSDAPVITTKQLQDKVKVAVQADLGSAILVDSVTIPIVHFDAATEDRLKAYQQAKADTRIAEQGKLTAQAQADAARLLSEQPGIEKGGVQYQNCLNLIDKLAKVDQLKNLPPTWNCDRGAHGLSIVAAK